MIMNHLKICLPVWAGGPYKLTQPNFSFCSCSELLPEAVLAAALCCVSMGGEQHVRQSVIQAEGPEDVAAKVLSQASSLRSNSSPYGLLAVPGLGQRHHALWYCDAACLLIGTKDEAS